MVNILPARTTSAQNKSQPMLGQSRLTGKSSHLCVVCPTQPAMTVHSSTEGNSSMTSMTSLTPAAKPERLLGPLFGGIDTHKNTHHVAVVDGVGRPVADREFATTPTGYTEIVAFFHSHGAVEQVGVEGTG